MVWGHRHEDLSSSPPCNFCETKSPVSTSHFGQRCSNALRSWCGGTAAPGSIFVQDKTRTMKAPIAGRDGTLLGGGLPWYDETADIATGAAEQVGQGPSVGSHVSSLPRRMDTRRIECVQLNISVVVTVIRIQVEWRVSTRTEIDDDNSCCFGMRCCCTVEVAPWSWVSS